MTGAIRALDRHQMNENTRVRCSVKSEPDYCPQPSAASVAKLFAPCQAFESAIGHAITKKEAVQMGLLTPDEQPERPATQLAAGEHATVGLASKRPH